MMAPYKLVYLIMESCNSNYDKKTMKLALLPFLCLISRKTKHSRDGFLFDHRKNLKKNRAIKRTSHRIKRKNYQKKKSGRFFSNKRLKTLTDKVGSNKTLSNAYQNAAKAADHATKVATNVASQVADHATKVAQHVAEQATKVSQRQGKTQRDSARLYVVISFDDTQPSASPNLKIVNTQSKLQDIQVFALTFNTGNCSLSDFNQSLPGWIPNDGSIDVYVLGFQELNQQKEAQEDDGDNGDEKKEMTDKQLQDDQQTIIEGYLSEYLTQYTCISHRNMWQTRIFIFAKQSHANIISNVVSDFVSAGLGGVLPNKGAVGVSFDFDGVSLCFLSCHLAAHQTKTKERNAMYAKICRNIRLGLPKQSLLGQFDCVVITGDLNYRVDVDGQQHEDKANPEIHAKTCQLIANNSFDELLKYDQLNASKKAEDAFVGFEEAVIDFAPSFKMERDSGMKYVTQRIPAWCDRILWRCRDVCKVKVNNYKMHDEVSISDHKPVSCVLNVSVWPRSCGISDEYKKAEIQLKDVTATDLISASASTDADDKPDPYIHFGQQLLLEQDVQTKSAYDCEPVSLELKRNNVNFLEHSVLMYQIKEREQNVIGRVSKQVMQMNVIGIGCIELQACVRKSNEWIPFAQPISSNGRKAGSLKGMIKLTLTQ
eukprot:599474_1